MKIENITKIILVLSFLIHGCGIKEKSHLQSTQEEPQPQTETHQEDPSLKCNEDETFDKKRSLCWKKCMLGMEYNWKGFRCGYAQDIVKYEQAIEGCRKLGARLPTVEEFESVLGNCREWDPPAEGWRKCNKCEQSEECKNLLGPWFYHQGFGLWASGKEPKRVIIWTGWVIPQYNETDPNENEMWAVCVRDIDSGETKNITQPGPATTR